MPLTLRSVKELKIYKHQHAAIDKFRIFYQTDHIPYSYNKRF